MEQARHNGCFFCTFKKKDDVIYATSMESNGLFVINMDGKAILKAIFPREKAYKRFLFSDCVCYNNKLIFAPDSAEKIYIYDLDTNQFKIIDFNLNIKIDNYNETFKFSKIVEGDEAFYFLPATYPYIVKMDKDTLEVKYIPVEKEGAKFWFRKQCINKNGGIYLVSINSPYVLRFDLNTEKINWIQFSNNETGGMSLCLIEDDI